MIKANDVMPVLTPDRASKRQNGRRFKEEHDDAFTLTGMDRHGVAIKVKTATKQGYEIAGGGDSINLSFPNSETRRGRVGRGVAQTLDTQCNQGVAVVSADSEEIDTIYYPKKDCQIAIRKLTPKECFRLQGFPDEYFERAKMVNSDSQLYKQSGNAVTVNVIAAIAKKLR